MKGRQIAYSPAELAWIKANATLSCGELHAEFCAAFGRSDVSQTNLVALRKRNGWRTGRTGQFRAGHDSWNAGLKGIHFAGSEKGWFAKGERSGVAVRLYKPIGTERVSKDGYRERKIHDGLPLQSRWRAVHLVEWEVIHGPLPKGMALKCIDGVRSNTSPSNWVAIPRALLPRLAGGNGRQGAILAYDDAPAELRPAVLAVAKLVHAVSQKSRGQ